jgi:hypothetical protein
MRKPWPRTLSLLLLLAPASAAAEAPLVKVELTLAEPVYRGELKEAEIRDLGTRVADFLAGEMSREVRFLRFTRGDAPFHLSVRLGEAGASRVSFHDVLFHIELTGPDRIRSGTTWLFRGSNAWGTGIGSAGQFRTEIETSLGSHDMAELVPEVLSAIPVARDGFLIQDQRVGVGWVVPFRPAEVCMDTQSEIKLKTEVASDLGVVPREFRAKATMPYNPRGAAAREELRHCLLCLAVPNQDGLDMVRRSRPSDVHVTNVYVMSYSRTQGCQEPLAPEAVAASFGGGR